MIKYMILGAQIHVIFINNDLGSSIHLKIMVSDLQNCGYFIE